MGFDTIEINLVSQVEIPVITRLPYRSTILATCLQICTPINPCQIIHRTPCSIIEAPLFFKIFDNAIRYFSQDLTHTDTSWFSV